MWITDIFLSCDHGRVIVQFVEINGGAVLWWSIADLDCCV